MDKDHPLSSTQAQIDVKSSNMDESVADDNPRLPSSDASNIMDSSRMDSLNNASVNLAVISADSERLVTEEICDSESMSEVGTVQSSVNVPIIIGDNSVLSTNVSNENDATSPQEQTEVLHESTLSLNIHNNIKGNEDLPVTTDSTNLVVSTEDDNKNVKISSLPQTLNVRSLSPGLDAIALDTKLLQHNDDQDEDDVVDVSDIDEDIDDALDEGYMGMECTLERGFSLSDPDTKQNERDKHYKNCSFKYKPHRKMSRYSTSLKHLIPVRKPPKTRDENPVDNTGLYSYITFSWMTSLMWQAYKKHLKMDDLPYCSKYEMCSYNTERFEHLWEEELREMGPDNASLQRVSWKFTRTRVIFALFLFISTLTLGFIGPTIFMRYLIDWISSDEPMATGAVWMLGLVLSEFFRIILFGVVWAVNYRTGVRLRAACLGLIYKKLMKLSSIGDKSVGELINLFANDGQRIYDFVVLGPLIVGGPFVAIGGIVYILWLLGPWALFGMLVFLLFYPFQYGISRLTGYLRRKTITITDERVRMMNELFTCVRLIKMYAWEKSFANTIAEIRGREKALLEKSAYVQSISLAMAPTVPVIAAIVTFMAHIGAGYNLTPAQVFSVVALCLGNLRKSVRFVSISTRVIVEKTLSLRRLQSILMMEEIKPYIDKPKDKLTAVSFKEATLAWDSVNNCKKKKKKKKNGRGGKKDGITPADKMLLPQLINQQPVDVLFDLNINIKKGELVGICGSVGAGKSSIISALLGHMRLQSGGVEVAGSCAYVGQQAWILNTTFRENILLGETFDPKRYYRVVYACSLTQDVTDLPGGDITEIGERGINLSGGQKQRVSLARALYADKDIYLLDDPLSAVDAQVGRHIFHWVIKAALKNKTTIFITHQLQYLPQCDRVLYLRDGHIAEVGSHTQLMNKEEGYAALYKTHMETVEDQHRTQTDDKLKKRIRTESAMSSGSTQSFSAFNSPEKTVNSKSTETNADKGQLMTEEKLDKGDIPSYVYHSYIQSSGGYLICSLVVLTFAVNVGSTAFSSWWLSFWLTAGSGNATITVGNDTIISDNIADNPDRWFYQLIYGLTIVVILVTSIIRGFAFMKTTLKASSGMHDEVFIKVFRSPMSFFDTTPSGRIINIFSRDMDEIDVRVPMTMETFLQNIWLIVCSLVFVCMIFPYFLPVLVVLSILFILIRNVFRIGIRDFKRLENISRSPLYSHVSTTVNGLSTIHAYRKQEMFTQRFMMLFDENSCIFYLFNCAMRWLAIRLDILALMVTASTALLTLLLRGQVEAAFAGLALAYAAQLSGIFQFTVRLSTETEARFTSVQRINSYIKHLVSEAPAIIESARPAATWPKHGRVTFHRVLMRYRPETPLVLKRVSFDIHSEEKIGIVGRTGSGKSSLGVALFRLVELCGGCIKIDGIDIATIGLDDLRTNLSIIPQDPVLFIGTIRYNLDPFNRYSDDKIWSCLEQTFMKDRISLLQLKLLAPVIENGENFSVGERQLICMARALLRNSKILFLDEATAAIDTETDCKIQKTLQTSFHSCTMITVAHRLNTVMCCSRIVVMKEGQVAEFDTPSALLSQPSSIFSKMVAMAEASNST